MKNLLRILSVVSVLTSTSALADSANFPNLNVNFAIAPLVSDDNIYGQIFGTGVNLTVAGVTFPGWFSIGLPYEPGSVGGGNTTIIFDSAIGTIGSHSYGFSDLGLGVVTLNAGSFTFPTNGQQNFTVTLPAAMTSLTVFADNGSGFSTFTLATKPGRLTLSFTSYAGLYYASNGSFTTVPEPDTLGMMVLGVGAVTWCWARRGGTRYVKVC